jgi:hypothetical protein
MPSIEVVLAIAAGFVGVLTLFVLFSTGSVLAVLVLWISIAMITLVLWYYEFIDLSNYSSVMMPKKEEPAAAAPDPADATTGTGPMVGREVFHVSDSQFTYADAPAVCAAYGAELATLEQRPREGGGLRMRGARRRRRSQHLVAHEHAAARGRDGALGDGVDHLGKDPAEAVADGVGGVHTAPDVGELALLGAGA